jgi:hypothetical protein
MRKPPLALDPFTLTRIGIGIWTTNVLVARQFAQAFREQNALIARGSSATSASDSFRAPGFERRAHARTTARSRRGLGGSNTRRLS